MKPIVILPPNAMSEADIQLLRDNGLCVVVAEDPAAVEFVDPLPAASSRNEIERGLLELAQRVMSAEFWNQHAYCQRSDVTRVFSEIIMRGTQLRAKAPVKRKTRKS